MNLINILDKRSVYSLKIMENNPTLYQGGQMVVMSYQIKPKKNAQSIDDSADISTVWFVGVQFDYMQFIKEGQAYIDRLKNLPQKSHTLIIKTKDVAYTTEFVEKYLQKGRLPIVNIPPDDIYMSSFSGILNYNLKAEKILPFFAYLDELETQQVGQLSGQQKDVVKRMIDSNVLDMYNYTILFDILLGQDKATDAFEKNKNKVQNLLN